MIYVPEFHSPLIRDVHSIDLGFVLPVPVEPVDTPEHVLNDKKNWLWDLFAQTQSLHYVEMRTACMCYMEIPISACIYLTNNGQ